MAQTSVKWLQERYNQGNDYERHLTEKEFQQANEMHKNECISFAEQWEARCNEKNMDSKEQLYDEIYKKII